MPQGEYNKVRRNRSSRGRSAILSGVALTEMLTTEWGE